MLKTLKWLLAFLCAAIACIMLSLTLTHPAYGIGLFALGAFIVTPAKHMKPMIAVLAILPTVCLGLRHTNFQVEIFDAQAKTLEPGQYTAKSDDIARLVTARLVIRDGGYLIFAEAHAAPGVGLDEGTLYREPHRALFYQGIPPAPDPKSDPITAGIVYNALSKAMAGRVPRQEPEVPGGATQWGGGDTYWGMFPNEFDHRCNLQAAKSGVWEGQSTNPHFPTRVRVTIADHKLANIEVLQKWHSEYGKAAFEQMPARMLQTQEVNLDAVSGATRSSLIVRSAVWNACQKAIASSPEPPKPSAQTVVP